MLKICTGSTLQGGKRDIKIKNALLVYNIRSFITFCEAQEKGKGRHENRKVFFLTLTG